MTLQLIGKIIEVEPTESTNKNTGKVTQQTTLTVQFDGLNEAGYRKLTVETIQLDEEYFDKLADNIDKYVAISYMIINSAKGTYVFPDSTMPPLVLEKNPLDYSAFKKTKTAHGTK